MGLWYKTRIIVPLPTTETQANIVVKQKMTDLFIEEAAVQLVNGVVNKAITNTNGEVEFKPIKQGVYQFKVLAPGYKPCQVNQQRLLKGKINRLEVELEPVG